MSAGVLANKMNHVNGIVKSKGLKRRQAWTDISDDDFLHSGSHAKLYNGHAPDLPPKKKPRHKSLQQASLARQREELPIAAGKQI
jgi:hypothetical protein